jgi:Domain of unknown function (DUF4832)/Domain of unknown function (DUF4874)/FlgD Ig-like domain
MGKLKKINIKQKCALAKLSFYSKRNLIALSLLLGFIFCLSHSANVTYTEDTSDFPNPERGIWGGTLRKQYVDLGNWKNTDLPQSLLDGLEKTWSDARNSGIKRVTRFKYTNGGDDDASLPQMLSHMEQLRQILQRNYDVIAVLEAGFVGGYGEWWGSTSVNTTETRRTVLFKLLDVLPKERMVAIRYNFFKRAIYSSNVPLGPTEAFSGSNRARTSAHNDCFITNEHDAGTYRQKGSDGWGLGYEEEKNYLSADNTYLSQGGETCDLGPTEDASCERALIDLKRMKWDMLNQEFNEDVLNQWKSQGCYEEISKRLGYRIRLLDASFDDEVTDGDLDFTLHLKNEGFGKIYNPRKLEMILRNTQSGGEHILPLTQDPRYWSPGLEQTLAIKLPIPKSVPFGSYSLFLNLPDPTPTLYGKPQYSIRLANLYAWQALKGYNALNHTVKISSFNPNSIRKNKHSSSGNKFALRGSFENQMNGSVGIDYEIDKTSQVSFKIFDLSGNLIRILADGIRSPGSYNLTWKGIGQDGRAAPEGVYLVNFSANGILETKRAFLQR